MPTDPKTTAGDDDMNPTNRLRTPEQVADLAEAMWQLLDDMGESGQSVCLLAKARARVAFDPFTNDMVEIQGMMPIEEARRIIGPQRK